MSASNRGGGSRGGGGNRGRAGPLPRSVQVSKKISWLLRHGAEEEGLKLDSAGFLNVQDVLSNRKIRSLKVSFDELKQIVEDNDKKRFTLAPVSATPSSNDQAEGEQSTPSLPSADNANPSDWLIRANQGHSIKVQEDGLLKPITTENMPEAAVHGTTHAAWPLILASGGLKPMKRNHVHFAAGLPTGFNPLAESNEVRGENNSAVSAAAPVISGMRTSSTILMFLDLPRALEAGIKFWTSDNEVILSEGDEKGVVPLEMFKRVEDRSGEGVLVEDGSVVKEAPASWGSKKGTGKGKG